jgi:hypothetical protein
MLNGATMTTQAKAPQSGADAILAREQCSNPAALTNTDEAIINRLRHTPWWVIAADEGRDYTTMLMCETNGEGLPR